MSSLADYRAKHADFAENPLPRRPIDVLVFMEICVASDDAIQNAVGGYKSLVSDCGICGNRPLGIRGIPNELRHMRQFFNLFFAATT